MEEDQILGTILANTYTLVDLNRRARILKNHAIGQIFGNLKPEELPFKDSQWLGTASKDVLDKLTKDNVYLVFDKLEKKINQMQALSIYVAFEMPQSEIDRLGVWLRSSFGGNFLFDLKLDPDLIGGCAFVWKGVYRDYSLRKRIEDKKEEILLSFKGIVE